MPCESTELSASLPRGYESESKGQVELQDAVVGYGIHLGNVLVASPSTEFVVDALTVTVANGSNDIFREAIGKCAVDAFHIAAAFEEVRVE